MYARLGGGGIGTAPATAKKALGVPPAQPHIEPAPYDAATDPGWQGLLDPNDHEFRNFLNQISPEERQMLLKRAQTLGAKGGGAQPAPAMPPAAMPPPGPGSTPPPGGPSPAQGM
jgi:hypothetical protein